jgi:phosphoglycerate dehydrogenase-like enzyme
MRHGVYLVNTSRGRIIDEAAFVRALESGKVAAAGVDVISTELDGIIANNPLVAYARAHSNLIITPHIGGFTLDSQRKALVHMAGKLARELT